MYALDGSIEMRDNLAAELNKHATQPRPKGLKYTVLSFSLSGCEITWCFGPGISTIFIAGKGCPHDLRVLSRQSPA